MRKFVVADADDFQYLKAPEGTNCPIDQIITSESQCKYAIFQIEGLTYRRAAVKRLDRPAGCFHGFGTNGYFKENIDSSPTTISSKEHFEGICKKKRKVH